MSTDKSLKALGTEPAKGMRDFLPRETALRDKVTNIVLNTYRSYGFERVETPILEDIRRLLHGDGGENLRLLFKVLKRGDKLDLSQPGITENDISEYGLRFDLTVPLVRYYANHRATLPRPFKAIQIGPVFRAERPQRGRYRQFYQCDIDVIGDASTAAEIEVITVTAQALAGIGFKGITVRLNDRRILSALGSAAGVSQERHGSLFIILDKKDKIGIEGVEKELLAGDFSEQSVQFLVSALKGVQSTNGEIPAALSEYIHTEEGKQGIKDLNEIKKSLTTLLGAGSAIHFDLTLVRGMGYYTGPIFEIELQEFPGISAAGGGRYDTLIGKMVGEQIPACGFSIGFERVMTILDEHPELLPSEKGARKVAMFFDNDHSFVGAQQVAQEIRIKDGDICAVFSMPKKLGTRLEQLKGAGYTHFVRFENNVLGEIKPI